MSELLEKLSQPLKQILQSELQAGNTIREISSGWPEPQSIFVLLESPFTSEYQITHPIEFREINDRHYWKAEYLDAAYKHLLVCGFEK
ncbi:hypothetical protein HNQ91_005704 [Filimonas zeae]|uniref:hypothetical protein n=1 Tax=Filimonas zeae TaxID=1737353 RepID=UPI001668A503|nr:hypothetical protein [Filimonas zeae]MDR6342620.1 hypothetical protein [Filimonas zeae]